jgi:hypothetical protein
MSVCLSSHTITDKLSVASGFEAFLVTHTRTRTHASGRGCGGVGLTDEHVEVAEDVEDGERKQVLHYPYPHRRLPSCAHSGLVLH